ncbi:hypothetical protein EDD29_6681 [Actinocorallia herbida]|uniref:Uncharacterized protein n=1 Tax=Actinocorallia herbida TaxID=58109 RepID=A0A3N1D639_9ACTN|nr:hypothetical protein [Actinocorallia herbida]ROO88994.1 hypothetical protein EDD29_6681 [Actinocorallia herbida]
MRRGLVVTGVGLAAALAAGVGAHWFEGVPLVRACEVLTGDFAAGVLGPSVLSNDDMGRRSTECQYMSTPAGGSVNLQAERFKKTKKESGTERARRNALRHHGKPYPGLGREAYLAIFRLPAPPGTDPELRTGMGQLVIIVDDVVVRAGVGGRSVKDIRAASDHLARAYLDRLDG